MIKNYESKGIEKLTIVFAYVGIEITFKIMISEKRVKDIKIDNILAKENKYSKQ